MTPQTQQFPVSAHRPDGRRAWSVLVLLTLAAGVSAPGQTIGVSVFIDPMLATLPVSRTQLSAAYLVGTLAGALALPRVGSWTDRVGVRRALLLVLGLFALATAVASQVVGLVTVTLSFTAMRLLGQGSLGVVTGTAVAVWFVRRRGLAMGLMATGSALLLAGAPLLFGRLIPAFGWRVTWAVASLLVAGAFVAVALALPAQPGARDDHGPSRTIPAVGGSTSSSGDAVRSFTRRAAMRTRAFWGIAAVASAINLLVTAVTFHHISIMAERGLDTLAATAVFLPQMIGGLLSGVAVGWLADRIAGRWTLALSMTLAAAGLLVGTVVTPGPVAVAYGLLIGAAPGAIRAVEGALLPDWFGTAHVGAIRGALASISIGMTAVGPLLLSLLEPLTFTVGLRVLAGIAWGFVALALTIVPPTGGPRHAVASGVPAGRDHGARDASG